MRVERTLSPKSRTLADGTVVPIYDTPKTRGSRRRVPLTPATVDTLRDYLALHPHGPGQPEHDPTAPLFPAFKLTAERPTGVAVDPDRAAPETAGAKAQRNADALASLTMDEAEARLELDWTSPVRHQNFYKAVFRPAALRATRGSGGRALPPALKFHALRHTYASLCVAASIPPLEIARFMLSLIHI